MMLWHQHLDDVRSGVSPCIRASVVRRSRPGFRHCCGVAGGGYWRLHLLGCRRRGYPKGGLRARVMEGG